MGIFKDPDSTDNDLVPWGTSQDPDDYDDPKAKTAPPTRLGSKFCDCAPGLYRVFWDTGGSSLAAVGVTYNGGRWLAPINWVAPALDPAWSRVVRMEKIDA